MAIKAYSPDDTGTITSYNATHVRETETGIILLDDDDHIWWDLRTNGPLPNQQGWFKYEIIEVEGTIERVIAYSDTTPQN